MLTAETNSSQKLHDTSDFLFSLIDTLPKPEEADLRGQFLHTRRNGERLTIPENTVAVETDSAMVLNDGFSSELLGQVTNIMQKYPDSFSTMEAGRFHFTRLEEDKKLTDLRTEMTEKNETSTDGSFKLTFLYKERPEDEEESPLSAVLVFGEPTMKQIEALRSKLPEDVPLLNGETNELLDATGSKEREQAERIQRLHLFLAALALRAYTTELLQTYKGKATTYESANKSPKKDAYSQQEEDTDEDFDAEADERSAAFWKNFREEQRAKRQQKEDARKASEERRANQEQSHSYGAQSNDEKADSSQYEEPGASYSETKTSAPEAKEEELNRRANDLLNGEAQKAGFKYWTELDDKSLSRAKGRIARDLYIGLEGANTELFSTVSGLIAKHEGPKPYGKNPWDDEPQSTA